VVLFAIAALSLSVPLMGLALFARPNPAHQRTVTNLRQGFQPGGSDAAVELNTRNQEIGQLRVLAHRLTPGRSIRLLEKLLARAGRPPAWPLDRLLAAKLVLPLGIGAVALLYLSKAPGPLSLAVGIGATVIGYFLPELLLHSRGQERSKKIAVELADTLDQMTIAVEAGLGFDSAMARAGKNGKGPLAEELVRTLQDIQVGQGRRQAYESLAQRTEVPDLRKFVRAIIQADKYGIAIADVLRTQASEMRMKRRQRAEEKAMQIPVKVIFPLMLCILPVLFIVLLGPAAMDIVAAFK
jgi:tight adherence protein C